MENLNAEQIKKALECCVSQGGCQKCSYRERGSITCMYELRNDALALITSQEQRIKQLTEERKDFEIRALRAENEATKYKDYYETEKQAREQLSESYDHLEKTKDELLAERSRLTEANERLRLVADMSDTTLTDALRIVTEFCESRIKRFINYLKDRMEFCSRSEYNHTTYFLVTKVFIDKVFTDFREENI